MPELTERDLVELRRCEVVMVTGSDSDWDEEKGMQECLKTLKTFGVRASVFITSAHRTPNRVKKVAEAINGRAVVIAGAGGAAHLAGMMAAHAPMSPVIAVPIRSSKWFGVDSLLSNLQMPAGVPLVVVGIGDGVNAAIFAAQIVAQGNSEVRSKLQEFRVSQAEKVPLKPTDRSKKRKRRKK